MIPRTLPLAQVIGLIVVVVLLVFGITYASLFLPGLLGSAPPPTAATAVQQLAFEDANTSFDSTRPPRFDEMDRSLPGQRYFWFKNLGQEAVSLRLVQLGCQCTRAEICILPEGTSTLDSKQLDEQAATADWKFEPLPENKPFEVPGLASGGVRLKWREEKNSQPTGNFTATFHTESGGVSGAPISVVARIVFVDPIRISPEEDLRRKGGEVSVGSLGPGSKSALLSFIIWSTTRKEFSLTGAAMRPHPCVVWTGPVKLDDAELRDFNKRDFKDEWKVLAAYRVTVRIFETQDEPTEGDKRRQMDLGEFRRSLRLTSNAGDDLFLTVTGSVKGDLDVRSIDFGPVQAGGPGTKMDKTVFLTSSVADLELKLAAEEKAPDFLQVEPPQVKTSSQGKSWELKVTLLTDKVLGEFPRDESVVVLWMTRPGQEPRKVRVPVTGSVFVKK